MTSTAPPLNGSENDYREIFDRSPSRSVTIAVVLPTYNRADRLDATLAGLARQTVTPDEVVVSDDGSDEDLGVVADRYRGQLPVTMVRRESEAFGAGQARNLGTASTHSDVIVFIDSDCIPDPNLLERHSWWHRRASAIVVVGNRYHVDGSSVTPALVADRFDDVRRGARRIPEDGSPDDWRSLFYRRNRKLQIGDVAFRAVVSSNMSVERELFDEVGGFPSGFHAWGGEDTELGWRLWNAGAFIAVDNEAVVYHQLEPGETREDREASIRMNRLLMTDRIPNRFYRRRPHAANLVPRVTWIAPVDGDKELDSVVDAFAASMFPDAELIVVASDEAAETAARVTENQRFQLASSTSEAIRMARGELLFLIDGRLVPHPRLVERAVRRFETDTRVGGVRLAYRFRGADTYRRLSDLHAVDVVNGRMAPLAAFIRRRELMKELRIGDEIDWLSIWDRIRVGLLINDTVKGDGSAFDLDAAALLPIGFDELTRAGAEESARTVVRAVRSSRTPAVQGEPTTIAPTEAVPIRYVGWTGQDNLGDEALLQAVEQLLPWAEPHPAAANPRMLMLGGGTLINSDGSYLRRIEQLDSPRLDRVIFGTGVRSPEYWGATEPMDRWWQIFDASLGVWVRGPRSLDHLRNAGYEGPVKVIGDPALALAPAEEAKRKPGSVIVSVMSTKGECWGKDDNSVHEAFASLVARFASDGRDVRLMSAHPTDDRWAIDVMRRAGHPNLDLIAGYDDVAGSMAEITAADLVVAERLHVNVLAAAAGVPFLGVEYRPKVADFAASVGAGDRTIRTDEITGDALYARAIEIESDVEGSARITQRVGELRETLQSAADSLRPAFD